MSVHQRRLLRRANPLSRIRPRRNTQGLEPAPEPAAVENAENAAPVLVTDNVAVAAIACVDLTEEDDDPSIVDLTNPADNSVIVLSSTPPTSFRRQGGQHLLAVELPDTDDIEVLHHKAATVPVPVTTFNRSWPRQDAMPVPYTSSAPIVLSASSSASTSSSASSDLNISCPICLDTHAQIIARKDIMMSTTCGHVFCQKCIKATMASQRLCPTCRRKLTSKSLGTSKEASIV